MEQELWRIFTYYALYGSPLHPEHMNRTTLLRLCRDCQLIEHISPAEIGIVFQTEMKRKKPSLSPAKPENANLLTRDDFLNVLLRISQRIYAAGEPAVVLQQLLTKQILPLASRHQLVDISEHLSNEGLRALVWTRFGAGLKQIFRYYATLSDTRRRKTAAEEMPTKPGSPQMSHTKRASAERRVQSTTFREHMGRIGYREYTQFSHDFKLTAAGFLTTIEVGDCFVSTAHTRGRQGEDSLSSIKSSDFLEVVLRLGLKAGSKAQAGLSAVDKLKGFFLLMYRNMTDEERLEQFLADNTRLDPVRSKAGDLNICGSALFNQTLLDMWRADEYRDYYDVREGVGREEDRACFKRDLLRQLHLQPHKDKEGPKGGQGAGHIRRNSLGIPEPPPKEHKPFLPPHPPVPGAS